MRRPLPMAVLLAAVVLTQTGCFLHAREITRTKRALEAEHPGVHLKKKTTLSLGPVSLWVAGGLMRLTNGDDYARVRPYLRYLHRVQVGVYETDGRLRAAPLAPSALPFLQKQDWRVAVSTQHGGEHVWVLYHAPPPGEPMRDLYLFTLGDRQFVALRLRGQVDRLVERFMKEEDVWDRLLGHPAQQPPAQEPPAQEAPAARDSARAGTAW